MISYFLFGFIGIVFALAAWIIIADVLQRKRSGAAIYSVWCGGSEVNDYYLTKEQAESLAFEYEIDGYENVTIRKEKGE